MALAMRTSSLDRTQICPALPPRPSIDGGRRRSRSVDVDSAAAGSTKARRDARVFVERMQGGDDFWRVLRDASASHGVPAEELQIFAEELCRCCWQEAEGVFSGQGALASAKAEVTELRQKLTQCNLSAMKQMAASKAGFHAAGEFGGDTMTLHEPMQYLDETSKELVLAIAFDKIRLLEQDRAPPSLLKAITAHAEAAAKPVGNVDAKLLREARAELEALRGDLKSARLRAEEAEDRARASERKLGEALKEVERRGQVIEQQQSELESQRAEIARLQAEIARQEAQIQGLRDELAAEKEANAELRAEVQRLEVRCGELSRKILELEAALGELQGRFDALAAEAEVMRAELARRNNTRTHGTQTTLTGQKIDEKEVELKKMRVMLEEMQMKMKELMDRCRRKFGPEVSEIVSDLGLKDLLKEETVFQRLFDDALDRVERLEKLREKVRKDRRELCPSKPSVAEPSVLEEVEASQLAGMRRLVEDTDPEEEPPPRAPAIWAQPAKMKEQGCGGPMRSVASLPVLPTMAQQSVTCFDFGAGAGKRGQRSLSRRRSGPLG